VPEHLGDRGYRNALLDGQGRGRMPEVVEAHLGPLPRFGIGSW
jgi:hypothetical protein